MTTDKLEHLASFRMLASLKDGPRTLNMNDGPSALGAVLALMEMYRLGLCDFEKLDATRFVFTLTVAGHQRIGARAF